MAAVLECRERLGSPIVALALDFSVAMTRLPDRFVAKVRELGFPLARLDALVALWTGGQRRRTS